MNVGQDDSPADSPMASDPLEGMSFPERIEKCYELKAISLRDAQLLFGKHLEDTYGSNDDLFRFLCEIMAST